jgi:alpha-tubulin suppressor-like RCC1 family protein
VPHHVKSAFWFDDCSTATAMFSLAHPVGEIEQSGLSIETLMPICGFSRGSSDKHSALAMGVLGGPAGPPRHTACCAPPGHQAGARAHVHRRWAALGGGKTGGGPRTSSAGPSDRRADASNPRQDLPDALADPHHSLAVGDDGTVWTWGWNGFGQLGTGSTLDSHVPTPVPGVRGVVAVAGGALHSMALRADATVVGWGWNGYGQLGDGTTAQRLLPAPVPGLGGVVGISAGAYHGLALRTDGTVSAWGWNAFGQLGDGTTTHRHSPVAVAAVVPVRFVAAGWYHSLMVPTDGSLLAFGWNVTGQLGDGTTVDRHSPVAVRGAPRAVIAAGGALHSLAD